MEQNPLRSCWKTRIGFLFAAIGSAVGLGNIWRFPYIAYKNGGGAFLVPYLIALFCIGITLMILEQGLGQKFHGSFPLSCFRVNRKWELLGWWPVVFVMFGIMLYYGTVISWCLNYLFFSLNLTWGPDTQSFFFKSFLGLTDGPLDFSFFRFNILIGVGMVWLILWYIVAKEIDCGIEKANMILMPLLFLLMFILVIWSLTLKGAGDGLLAYVKPHPDKIFLATTWSDAFSQIFFTLSLGFGIMTAYASYLPKKSPVVNNAIITSLTNCGFEMFAGVAVFSTLGYMAFVSKMPVANVVTSGPGLAFITYPQAINLLPIGKKIFGVLFFLTLIFAGITSAMSIIEAFASGVIDKFGWKREKIVTIICIIGFLGSAIFTMGNGLYLLDIVDHFLNNYGLLCIGLLEAVLIGWIFGSQKFIKLLNMNPGLKIGFLWNFMVRYFIPTVIVVILLAETYNNIKMPYGGYSWVSVITIGVGWLLITILGAVVFTKMKWRVKHVNL